MIKRSKFRHNAFSTVVLAQFDEHRKKFDTSLMRSTAMEELIGESKVTQCNN